MRKVIFVLILLIPMALQGQQKYGTALIDSFLHELNAAKGDTNEVKALAGVSFAYYQINTDSGIIYGSRGLALAEKLKWESGLAMAFNSLGVNYLYKSDYPKALECYEKALVISDRSHSRAGIAKNYGNMGLVYECQSNYPKALEFYFKALKINEELGDKKAKSNDLANIGNVYLRQGSNEHGVSYTLQALHLCEELGDSSTIADLKAVLASIRLEQNDYDGALKYLFEVLTFQERLGNRSSAAFVLGNIGRAYRLQKKYSEALTYGFRALRLMESLGEKRTTAEAKGQLGVCFLEIAKNIGSIKKEGFIPSGREASLGEAVAYLKGAIADSKEISDLDQLQEYSGVLAEVYTLSGDYKQALEIYRQSIAFRDSVFSQTNRVKLEAIETQRALDLKNKDLEIEKLRRSNESSEDVLYVIGIILLVAVIAGLLWYFNKERRASKQKIKSNNHKFRTLIEHNADAVAIIGPDRKPSYVSPTVQAILGYTDQEAMSYDIFAEAHPDDIAIVQETVGKVMANPGLPVESAPVRMKHKDGHWVWTGAKLTNMLHDPVINGIIDNFRDVTANKLAEEKVTHINRLYSFVSQINQAIVRVNDEQAIFEKACEIAVEYGKFGIAIISAVDIAARKLSIRASNKVSEADLKAFVSLQFSETGAIANVMASGNSSVVNDYAEASSESGWKQYTEAKGFKSAIILPLKGTGKVKWVFSLYSTVPHFFNEEEVALLEEAAYDISFAVDGFEREKRRKEMEDSAIHNELKLKEAQSMSHVGSWELDFTTGNATWSDETCRIFGVSQVDGTLSERFWFSFIHPDDMDEAKRIIDVAHASLSSTAFYHRIIRKDGAIRHLYSQADFIFDSNGKPTGMHGAVHDVTEMKEAEIALAQSEANLRLIMDLIPQSVYAKDYNGKYLFVNKSSAALYGLTTEQLNNTLFQDSIPVKEEAEDFFRQCREVIETGETMVIPESTLTDHEGNVRSFHTVKLPFTVAGTIEKAVLAVATDITEQKKAETERLKIVADIVQRNKGLEQFSYIVSHNLRAPVSNIIALADLLQLKARDSQKEDPLLQGLATSVRKLDEVIRDLNHVLQVKHQVSEKKEKVIFSELYSDIKLSIENLLRREDVSIVTDFNGVDEIMSFKSYLYSIFFNLISNSIKYHQPGIAPFIEITSGSSNGLIWLTFKDNGLGIDLKKKGGQVFGLYKRFHDHTEGKGMGLFMVKTQVEALGGTITIESEVNKGTTFRIEFENK